jgi:urease accessory protein
MARAGELRYGLRRMLSGHLELICAADAAGRSHLRHQSFQAPIHLSKPHLDEGVLVVNVVNPTAGLFSEDRIAFRIAVESGAALLLTAPSASRAHRMKEGHAEVAQDLRVAASGWLECWPEIFIPQGGTRYRQKTRIAVEEGGEMLFFESLAPGRVASGEAFAFSELLWETEILVGEKSVARERYRLQPGDEAIGALRRQFDTAYYASCFAISPRLTADHPCWERLHALHGREAWIGCGALVSGGFVVKIVAEGSVALRRLAALVREELHAALGRRAPSLRRAGWP